MIFLCSINQAMYSKPLDMLLCILGESDLQRETSGLMIKTYIYLVLIVAQHRRAVFTLILSTFYRRFNVSIIMKF